MAVTDGAAKGAAAGSFLGMPGAVAGAAIGGITSLIGGKKGSDSSKSAAQIQAQLAREALAEQKRVYELEDKKERERYETTRKDTEYDRAKTLQDEARVRASRSGAFGGFNEDLGRFSKGYAAPLGMSQEQSQAMLNERTSGMGGGGQVQPQMGDKGMGPGPDPMNPSMPSMTMGPAPGMIPGQSAPSTGSGALGSTVWLESPDGQEQMEVSIQDAPLMMQKGARLIPAPTGGR